MGKAVWTDGLHFLGCTRHDGHNNGLLALVFLIAPVVFLDDCGEHFLRRTAGRKIVFVFGILVTEEFHPCRTAGGEKRKLGTVSQTLQEFLGFFHDG